MPASLATMADVIKWFSNDLQMPSPEDLLLDKLRVADTLVHEIRLIEAKLHEKEEAAEKLNADLSKKDETIASLRKNIEIIESGLFQRLAGKYYKVRNSLLPEGTFRKRLYERVIRSIKER